MALWRRTATFILWQPLSSTRGTTRDGEPPPVLTSPRLLPDEGWREGHHLQSHTSSSHLRQHARITRHHLHHHHATSPYHVIITIIIVSSSSYIVIMTIIIVSSSPYRHQNNHLDQQEGFHHDEIIPAFQPSSHVTPLFTGPSSPSKKGLYPDYTSAKKVASQKHQGHNLPRSHDHHTG